MATPATITVEFFGIPRQRADRAELVVQAGTVAEALAKPRDWIGTHREQFVRDLLRAIKHGMPT